LIEHAVITRKNRLAFARRFFVIVSLGIPATRLYLPFWAER